MEQNVKDLIGPKVDEAILKIMERIPDAGANLGTITEKDVREVLAEDLTPLLEDLSKGRDVCAVYSMALKDNRKTEQYSAMLVAFDKDGSVLKVEPAKPDSNVAKATVEHLARTETSKSMIDQGYRIVTQGGQGECGPIYDIAKPKM